MRIGREAAGRAGGAGAGPRRPRRRGVGRRRARLGVQPHQDPEAAGEVAPVSLPAADEFDLIPADAAGFAHVRAADLWKTDALAEYRRVVGKAGDDAAQGARRGLRPRPVHPRPGDRGGALQTRHSEGAARHRLPPAEGRAGSSSPRPLPVDSRPDLDVVGILTFSAPFDPVKVREANLPKAVKFIAGEAEVWGDEGSGTAIAARGDRTLIVGSDEAVRAFLSRPNDGRRPARPGPEAGRRRHPSRRRRVEPEGAPAAARLHPRAAARDQRRAPGRRPGRGRGGGPRHAVRPAGGVQGRGRRRGGRGGPGEVGRGRPESSWPRRKRSSRRR